MNSIAIDFDGVVNIINSFKISSTRGIHGINSKILRNTSLGSGLFLTRVFNRHWRRMRFPKIEWLARSFQFIKAAVNHLHLTTGLFPSLA